MRLLADDVPNRYKEMAEVVRSNSETDVREAARLLEEAHRKNAIPGGIPPHEALVYCSAARAWVNEGCQRLRLSDSLAALFRLTKTPEIDVRRLPHRSLLLEIPGKFYPMSRPSIPEMSMATSTAWVLFSWVGGDAGNGIVAVCRNDTLPLGVMAFRTDDGGIVLEDLALDAKRSWDPVAALRFLANSLVFLTEHSECVSRSARSMSGGSPVMLAKPPVDVVVTRELRDAAEAVAKAVGIGGVKRAMAHFVRGHWRNQPCGEGRQEIRRTWVRPHKRGDESLGRVVERITKIHGGEN